MIFCAGADVPQECRIKNIGKDFVAPMQPERGSKCGGGSGRKHGRSSARNKFIRPAADRVEFPARQPICDCGTPGALAAVFLAARVGIWHAVRISDSVLIEADRVHALGQKASTVRIDKPERAVALVNAEKAAAAEAIIANSSPSGSLHSDIPTAGQLWVIYRTGRPRILDISQDRMVDGAVINIALRTLIWRKG